MLDKRIKDWMEAHREEYLKDLTDLVAIPSVAKDQDDENAPYGPDCVKVLEFMLSLGRRYGFQTENIENRIGRIIYSPETERDIGVWGHLDVVDAGTGWQQEDPFALRLVEGDWAIGRGVRDDKGPTLAVLYALRYLKEAGVPCPRGLSLYMGCSEETGLKDVIWYVNSGHRCPGWSLVVDSSWPLTYGEKGMLSLDLYAQKSFSNDVLTLQGGLVDNAVPGVADITLRSGLLDAGTVEGEAFTLEELPDGSRLHVAGRACHSAFPGGGINAIGLLAELMCKQRSLCPGDLELWEEICSFSATFDGHAAGVDISDPDAGSLTCVATTLRFTEENKPKLHLNIRYPAITTGERIKAGIGSWCETHGWHMEVVNESDAYMLPLDHPMVVTLKDTYNDIMETQGKPFILAGGTYAGRLPNAVGYGMGGRVEPGLEQIVPKGHGHPHGPDECGRISTLLQGASIYAAALERLAALEESL